jgi:hypothetical protein
LRDLSLSLLLFPRLDVVRERLHLTDGFEIVGARKFIDTSWTRTTTSSRSSTPNKHESVEYLDDILARHKQIKTDRERDLT